MQEIIFRELVSGSFVDSFLASSVPSSLAAVSWFPLENRTFSALSLGTAWHCSQMWRQRTVIPAAVMVQTWVHAPTRPTGVISWEFCLSYWERSLFLLCLRLEGQVKLQMCQWTQILLVNEVSKGAGRVARERRALRVSLEPRLCNDGWEQHPVLLTRVGVAFLSADSYRRLTPRYTMKLYS